MKRNRYVKVISVLMILVGCVYSVLMFILFVDSTIDSEDRFQIGSVICIGLIMTAIGVCNLIFLGRRKKLYYFMGITFLSMTVIYSVIFSISMFIDWEYFVLFLFVFQLPFVLLALLDLIGVRKYVLKSDEEDIADVRLAWDEEKILGKKRKRMAAGIASILFILFAIFAFCYPKGEEVEVGGQHMDTVHYVNENGEEVWEDVPGIIEMYTEIRYSEFEEALMEMRGPAVVLAASSLTICVFLHVQIKNHT